jgi:hypothetical protein
MNMPGATTDLRGRSPHLLKASSLVLFLLFLLTATACSDETAPVVPATPTGNVKPEKDRQAILVLQATETAADPPRTPVPTGVVDICTLLTTEEVTAAVGKPMEPVTFAGSGRCLYQGDAEFLRVTTYAGMSEADAKKVFDLKWLNPQMPNGIQGGGQTIYGRERDIDDLGDEAFIGGTARTGVPMSAAFVRQGSKFFVIQWTSSQTDKDFSHIIEDLARKVLPRLP